MKIKKIGLGRRRGLPCVVVIPLHFSVIT